MTVVRRRLARSFKYCRLSYVELFLGNILAFCLGLAGRELFVGINKRTNEAGAQQVARAFPDYPCLAVPMDGPLHLKVFKEPKIPHQSSIERYFCKLTAQ